MSPPHPAAGCQCLIGALPAPGSDPHATSNKRGATDPKSRVGSQSDQRRSESGWAGLGRSQSTLVNLASARSCHRARCRSRRRPRSSRIVDAEQVGPHRPARISPGVHLLGQPSVHLLGQILILAPVSSAGASSRRPHPRGAIAHCVLNLRTSLQETRSDPASFRRILTPHPSAASFSWHQTQGMSRGPLAGDAVRERDGAPEP